MAYYSTTSSQNSKLRKLVLGDPLDTPTIKTIRVFVFIFIAILWHLLFLTLPWNKLLQNHKRNQPLPVELTQIDPKTLSQIKKSWDEKPLLLDQNQVSSNEIPENSRFMSARNIKVEKEQRARHSQVIPQANKTLAPQIDQQQTKTNSSEKSNTSKLTLNKLGVPLYPTKKESGDRLKNNEKLATKSLLNGGDQSITDNSLPLGAENLLNAQESKFYNFYSRMYERIGPLWQSQMYSTLRSSGYPRGTYYAQVEITLDTEGVVRNIEIIRSSGISDFDEVIVKAWKQLRQFPHPPLEIIKNERVITSWSFQIQIDESHGGWNTPAPYRNY